MFVEKKIGSNNELRSSSRRAQWTNIQPIHRVLRIMWLSV